MGVGGSINMSPDITLFLQRRHPGFERKTNKKTGKNSTAFNAPGSMGTATMLGITIKSATTSSTVSRTKL